MTPYYLLLLGLALLAALAIFMAYNRGNPSSLYFKGWPQLLDHCDANYDRCKARCVSLGGPPCVAACKDMQTSCRQPPPQWTVPASIPYYASISHN